MRLKHAFKCLSLCIEAVLLLYGSLPLRAASPPGPVQYIPRIRHISVEEKLPNREVVDVYQDHQGFVWLSTFYGAHRFDGYSFQSLHRLSPDGQRSTSTLLPGLSSDYVSAVRQDQQGNFWIFGNDLGPIRHLDIRPAGSSEIRRFDVYFKRPLPFNPNDVNVRAMPPVNSPDLPILIPTFTGELWQHTGEGRFRRLFQHPRGVSVVQVRPTHRQTLLVTFCGEAPDSESNLLEITLQGRVLRWQSLPARMRPVMVDSTGNIYLQRFVLSQQETLLPQVGARQLDNCLFRLTPTGQLDPVPITYRQSPFPAGGYQFDWNHVDYDARRQLFWYWDDKTVFAWHPRQGIVFNLEAEGHSPRQFHKIHSLMLDRDGVVWLGTAEGILTISLKESPFQLFLHVPGRAEGADGGPQMITGRGMARQGDWLWVNAYVHPRLIHLKTGRIRYPETDTPSPGKSGSFQIYLLPAVSGPDGATWAAAHELVRFDPVTNRCRVYPLSGNNLCWAIWPDQRGNLYLGYEQGLSYFDVKQKRNLAFRGYNRYPELARSFVQGFFADPQAGGVWVASSSGLYLLDTLRGITARYHPDERGLKHLPFDRITFVHADARVPHRYWLATQGGGLLRWDRKTGRCRQFTRTDGLSHDVLYSIDEDRHQRLWITSSYGLICLDKRTLQIRVFGKGDGLSHDEFVLTGRHRSSDGRLFLGTFNGITAFYPDALPVWNRHTEAPFRLIQCERMHEASGRAVDLMPDLAKQREIVLQPGSRSLRVSFALLDYHNSQQNRYGWRLAGWQDDWTQQTENHLTLQSLPPGKFTLQIKAQNPDGQWSSQMLTIPIRVLPPLYQRGWFQWLCLAVLVGALLLLQRWRTYRLRQENLRLEGEVARRTARIEADKILIEQQASELKETDQLKSRFFANVSHEFRTPLTLILGPIQFLKKRVTDGQAASVLTSMENAAHGLLGLVSDLLDASRLEAGRMDLHERPADLRAVVARIVSSFESQAAYTGLTLSYEGPAEAVWLLIDTAKLETVLKNLLINALRYTPAGGQITVALREEEKDVCIRVQDTGPGIHPDDLPHIFERYYQSRRPEATLQGGTGIGLALVQEFCQLWGGSIRVESQPGRGTVFNFTYPKRTVGSAAPAASAVEPMQTGESPALEPAEREESALPARSETLLLVEDNPDMMKYLQVILAPQYRLQTAPDGLNAWEWLTGLPPADYPQLIISDVMMPRMDGLTLLQELKRHDTLRYVPIVLLTARTALQEKVSALQAGVADYLTKPFDEDELLARVQNLLERARERDAWREQSADPLPPTVDERWLQQLETLVEKNLTDSLLQVGYLADEMNISERQFYRRVKELTGLSPNGFIQEVRLQTARTWLETHKFMTAKEVCHAVGFQKYDYFSRLFTQRFGKQPSDFVSKKADAAPAGRSS